MRAEAFVWAPIWEPLKRGLLKSGSRLTHGLRAKLTHIAVADDQEQLLPISLKLTGTHTEMEDYIKVFSITFDKF